MKQIYRSNELRSGLLPGPAVYREFLRVSALSAGIYHLEAGVEDPQQPHDEDEVYFIVKGQGRFITDGGSWEVGPGDFIYVPAHQVHRFAEIDAAMDLLVIFAPPEGTADG